MYSIGDAGGHHGKSLVTGSLPRGMVQEGIEG